MSVHPVAPAASLPPPLLASRFAIGHLWMPAALGTAVFALLMGLGGDQWLADHVYQLQGGRWALRDAWLTRSVVHEAGKWLSAAAALLVMVLCFHHWRRRRDRPLRWALLYLVVAVALGTGMVSLLKSLLPMECPWDLLRYGGQEPFVSLFSRRPAGMAAHACFPAGHASAGYAWLSLYFSARLWRPAWRWAGLCIGLCSGLVFGIGQQLRGAHFLSHDVATALLCWLLSLGLYLVVRRQLDRSTRCEPIA